MLYFKAYNKKMPNNRSDCWGVEIMLRKSIVTTTNLVFSKWECIFKDPMTTLAAIDRVVHHSVVLDLMGVECYRAKAAGAKSTPSAAIAV